MWMARSFLFLAIATTGCGTNLNEVLLQGVEAAGRTTLDLLLTDLANNLAGAGDQGGTTPPDDGDADVNGSGMGDEGTGGPPLSDLMGDAAGGEMVFVTNNCASCHCADATGGCALDAPSIAGRDVETVDDTLRGTLAHPTKVDLADQEIADLAAYLGSL